MRVKVVWHPHRLVSTRVCWATNRDLLALSPCLFWIEPAPSEVVVRSHQVLSLLPVQNPDYQLGERTQGPRVQTARGRDPSTLMLPVRLQCSVASVSCEKQRDGTLVPEEAAVFFQSLRLCPRGSLAMDRYSLSNDLDMIRERGIVCACLSMLARL